MTCATEQENVKRNMATTETFELVWKLGATCFAIATVLILAWAAYPLAQIICGNREK